MQEIIEDPASTAGKEEGQEVVENYDDEFLVRDGDTPKPKKSAKKKAQKLV